MSGVNSQGLASTPVQIRRVAGRGTATLYSASSKFGCISKDMSSLDAPVQTDLDAKIQGIWGRVIGSLPTNSKDVRVNLTKLYISYEDQSGKVHYVNLGEGVDPTLQDLQNDVMDLRASILGVWKNTRWSARTDDLSNRPLVAARPFSEEKAPAGLYQSAPQFFEAGGGFQAVSSAINDKAESNNAMNRVVGGDEFLQVWKEKISERLKDKEKEIKEKKKETKEALKKLEDEIDNDKKSIKDADKRIKKLIAEADKLGEKANKETDPGIQASLRKDEKDKRDEAEKILNTEKKPKETELLDKQQELVKQKDLFEKELAKLKKIKEELEKLKNEASEVDRNACFWAIGLGKVNTPVGSDEREERLKRTQEISRAMAGDLSTRTFGILRKSLENSVIETYAEEVGDLILFDRMEYIESVESSNKARLDKKTSPREMKGGSLEALAVQSALYGYSYDRFSRSYGLNRFSKETQSVLKLVYRDAKSAAEEAEDQFSQLGNNNSWNLRVNYLKTFKRSGSVGVSGASSSGSVHSVRSSISTDSVVSAVVPSEADTESVRSGSSRGSVQVV